MAWHRAIHGIDFPHPTYEGISVRLEPGDVTDKLPEGAVAWLVEAGHVEPCAAPIETPRPEAAPKPPIERKPTPARRASAKKE